MTTLPGPHGSKGRTGQGGGVEGLWLERLCLGLCGLWDLPDQVTQDI